MNGMRRVWLFFLVVALLLAGCGGDADIAEQATAGWTEMTGDEVVSAEAEKYGSGMSESHRMMAAFILKRNGMESDLDQYESVYLVTIVLADGQEYGMVVADGQNVYPENIQ
jgi:hypothetical protein